MSSFEAVYRQTLLKESFISRYVAPGKAASGLEFFRYNANIVGGGSGLAIIRTQADSDFICVSISSLITSGVSVVPGSNIQITDQSTGKTFFNRNTSAVSVTGSRGFPALLTVPRLIRPNANIIVESDVGGGSTLYLSLAGVRIYY